MEEVKTKSEKRRDRRKAATEAVEQAKIYIIGGVPCPFQYPESEYRRAGKWHTPEGTLVVELIRTK